MIFTVNGAGEELETKGPDFTRAAGGMSTQIALMNSGLPNHVIDIQRKSFQK